VRTKFNLLTQSVHLVFESDDTCLNDMGIETLEAVAAQNVVLHVLTEGEEWRSKYFGNSNCYNY
jgi:hypothetical protein